MPSASLLVAVLATAIVLPPAWAASSDEAPATANAPRLFISAAEIADRVAAAAAKAQEQYQRSAHTAADEKAREDFEYSYLQDHFGPPLQWGPFSAQLDYHSTPRVGNGFRVHEHFAELLFVLEGGGTLSVGGTLVNPTPVGPGQFQAPSAQGAVPHRMAKGDVILVPANIAHGQTQVDSGSFVALMMPLPLLSADAPVRASATPNNAATLPAATRMVASRQAIAAQLADSSERQRGGPILEAGPFHAELNTYSAAARRRFTIYENEAQLDVVVEGSGTISVGGSAVHPTRIAPGRLEAHAAQGAVIYKLNQGDMVLVPPKAAQALVAVPDGKLEMMTIHLPLPKTSASAP